MNNESFRSINAQSVLQFIAQSVTDFKIFNRFGFNLNLFG